MFIDLDSFKSVNDTMGHSAGDIVLKSMAERFAFCVRKEDTVSRFGGDEYLIQICNFEKVEDLHKITKKIMDSLQKPILVNNVEFVITASVGVAVYPVDGEDPETLIKNADIAMYTAKNKGKNEYAFCSPKMKNDVVKKMKLTNKLCNSDIIATVTDGMISTMEDRRNKISKRQGAVSVSVMKENKKTSKKMGEGRCLNTMVM